MFYYFTLRTRLLKLLTSLYAASAPLKYFTKSSRAVAVFEYSLSDGLDKIRLRTNSSKSPLFAILFSVFNNLLYYIPSKLRSKQLFLNFLYIFVT